jgi:hypothetical protein
MFFSGHCVGTSRVCNKPVRTGRRKVRLGKNMALYSGDRDKYLRLPECMDHGVVYSYVMSCICLYICLYIFIIYIIVKTYQNIYLLHIFTYHMMHVLSMVHSWWPPTRGSPRSGAQRASAVWVDEEHWQTPGGTHQILFSAAGWPGPQGAEWGTGGNDVVLVCFYTWRLTIWDQFRWLE